MKFISPDLTVHQWSDIEPYFDELRESNPQTLLGLQHLIRHYSNVLSVYSENFSRAGIALGANTLSRSANDRYEHFLREIEPVIEPARHAIDQKIVSHPRFSALKDEEFRNARVVLKHSVKTFREENIDLKRLDEELTKRAEEIFSVLGLKPVAYLESTDREVRADAWLRIHEERYGVKKQLDVLLGAMIELRHGIAQQAGCRTYREFVHESPVYQHSVADAVRFHRVVEKHVVPVANAIMQRRKKRLGLTRQHLLPWDIDGTPEGEEPLRPFKTIDEFVQKTAEVLSLVKPEFGRHFLSMAHEKLPDGFRVKGTRNFLDLASRDGKGQCPYCESLEATRMPFISMNATGTHADVETLLHESGHAMHIFSMKDDPLIFNRYEYLDLTATETTSTGMEFLSSMHWREFYNEEEVRRARRRHLEDVILVIPWYTMLDKFQHWMYEHPLHTSAERDDCFAHLMGRFDSDLVRWNGLERFRKNSWQQVSHLFSTPFYYIQYPLAYLGALQLYKNAREAPKETVHAYLRGMRVGASKPFPKVWREMGIRFDISPAAVQELMSFAAHELSGLEQ